MSIYGVDTILNNFSVVHMVGKDVEPVDFNGDMRLMIPWYSYIVGAMASNQGSGKIWLSRYPYPYQECMDHWRWITKRFQSKIKYQRQKARKSGEEFDKQQFIDDFVELYSHPWREDPQLREVCEKLINRKRGEKIEYPLTKGARLYMTNLANEMAKNGLDPAEYGYVIKNGEVVNFLKCKYSGFKEE